MAMTKTIQATVKNRTDTAANWTQKNPVLAEGEIIVVQTSAGETRLKIGDGVKTFTQLPYIDEQIYNNVVTSVNGQAGDITIKTAYQYAQDGGYTGTEEEFSKKLASGLMIIHVTDNNGTLSADKSYIDIENALITGTTVIVDYDGSGLPLIAAQAYSKYFGTTVCANDETGAVIDTNIIEITSNGEVNDLSAQIDIPTEVTPLIGTTDELTPSQVRDAVLAGRPVVVQTDDELKFTNFTIVYPVLTSAAIYNLDDVWFVKTLYGSLSSQEWVIESTQIATTPQVETIVSGKQDKATLEADVAAKGFTKNTGTYSKPAGGIPKSDLDTAVQTSLDKADSALQEHQSLTAYRTAAAQDVIDSGKVDKVDGKGLSTNDYTAVDKAKVDAIPANPKYTDTVYDDTALKERIATIEGKESAWDTKSDFSGSYNDLTDKPTPLTGTTGTLTPTQVYNAMSAGIPVYVQYFDETYGWLSYTNFNVAENMNMIVANSISIYYNTYILSELYGDKANNTWGFTTTTLAEKADIPDIPATRPNPNAITFTGAVTGTYDGSEAVTINIPEGSAGNMKKLTFTGAVTGEYDGTTDVNVDIPIATTSTVGTIKVGNGLSISADGTLSVTTATYYTGTADPVNTLGADGDLYLKTEG